MVNLKAGVQVTFDYKYAQGDERYCNSRLDILLQTDTGEHLGNIYGLPHPEKDWQQAEVSFTSSTDKLITALKIVYFANYAGC